MSRVVVKNLQDIESGDSASIEDIISHKLPFNPDLEYPEGSLGEAIKEAAAQEVANQLRQQIVDGDLLTAEMLNWRERTVADRLNDTANVKDYGAIADGSLHPLSERFLTLAAAQAIYPHVTALSQSIDWAAAQAALNSGTARVHFPGGTYVCTDNLTRNTSILLVGDGTTTIQFATGKQLLIAGELTPLPNLAANITPTSRSVSFASAPGLNAGDVFIAYNPTDYSWSPHRAYYRAGEYFRCHSVVGNVANIYGVPADIYAAADMQMYKMKQVQVGVEDINVIAGDGTIGTAMAIRFAVGVTLKNYRGSGGDSYQIEIDRCYQVDVYGGAGLNNSPFNDDEYGILISNSARVTIVGGGHSATRHAIGLGGGSGICCVPNRDVLITNAVITNSSGEIGAADMHGNNDRVIYSNCIILAQAHMAGRDTAYKGCVIYGRTAAADGLCIYATEIVGGVFTISDCEFVTYGDGSSFGYVHFAPAALLRQDVTLMIRGLTIRGGAGGSNARLVRGSVATGETNRFNVDIQGLRCELSQALCVLFVRCETSLTQPVISSGLIVDNIYGPAGMALIQDSGAAIASIQTRQMTQRGEVEIVTTVADNARPASPINFRYRYSKRPAVLIGAAGANGSVTTKIGGQAAVPVCYSADANTVRPAIVAPSGNFTSGVTALLSWQAGIGEI